METALREELKRQGDPRMNGQGEIFDQYPVASEETRDFHQRYTSGEKVKAGWVNPSDFEKAPLE